jgi:hypothetical protein
VPDALGHEGHGARGGILDGVVRPLVEADVDILAAPDVEVEVVRVVAVVVGAAVSTVSE